MFDRLRAWRQERAQADGVPAYVVFHDATLAAIAERRPRDRADLAAIPGVGPTKLERYADEVLAVVRARAPLSPSEGTRPASWPASSGIATESHRSARSGVEREERGVERLRRCRRS